MYHTNAKYEIQKSDVGYMGTLYYFHNFSVSLKLF